MYVDDNYVIGNPNNFEIAGATDSLRLEKMVLCVGRFDDYVKRIDRILECFSLVLDTVPDAKLVLVGRYDNNAPIRPDGTLTVNGLMRELAIPPDSVNFVGEINNVQDYYARASVLLLTSNSEGFGMVLNEAACFGVPSVCNYIPGIEDIMIDGENGYIVEQDDLSSMALKVGRILNDKELQKELGDNAKKNVRAYDAQHVGNKWRYLIESLIEIKDESDLRERLSSQLGYKVQDQWLVSKVLSKELNEIFYAAIKDDSHHKIANNTRLVLSKAKSIPGRLKANIEYEGLYKTTSKIATRSYRVARRAMKL